jgi:hypothetical protein
VRRNLHKIADLFVIYSRFICNLVGVFAFYSRVSRFIRGFHVLFAVFSWFTCVALLLIDPR